ncbi:hypothetical protein Bca101_035518 [Brassica carinata]
MKQMFTFALRSARKGIVTGNHVLAEEATSIAILCVLQFSDFWTISVEDDADAVVMPMLNPQPLKDWWRYDQDLRKDVKVCWMNHRGISYTFGSQKVVEFLIKNDMALICNAQQTELTTLICTQRGQWLHLKLLNSKSEWKHKAFLLILHVKKTEDYAGIHVPGKKIIIPRLKEKVKTPEDVPRLFDLIKDNDGRMKLSPKETTSTNMINKHNLMFIYIPYISPYTHAPLTAL